MLLRFARPLAITLAGTAVAFALWSARSAAPDAGAAGETVSAATAAPREARRRGTNKSPEFNADRAYSYLVRICRLGSRTSGTPGMTSQQELLTRHFRELGARVTFQPFDVAHPLTGEPVRMNNMLVSWKPDAQRRVLLACHYDTRPFPDMDRQNPRGLFLGANDGASGVALMMELAHHMQTLNSPWGVDFVLFDGEELVYGKQGKYFLGSEHFARAYTERESSLEYTYGILLDMVADKRLELYMEKNSLRHAPELTRSLWRNARRAGVREFVYREKHEVLDDHIPLNTIAGIPTCDVIDFDYPYWHTMQDIPANCSGVSMVKVGRAVWYWLESGDLYPVDN